MKKLLALLSLVLILPFSNVMAQKEFNVNGVIVPRTLEFKGRELSLNGVGQRSKMFTELYVQALYLSQLSQDAQFIVESDTEMAVRIQITSALVSSKKLSKALEKGIEKSVGSQGILKFSDKLLQLEKKKQKKETPLT